ncbi:MAG: isoprenoid biosynthesis protein ElbB [Alphaproteobacteria bacterium 33-17]|nr:MAG: isoprenoid biosynthesis protein ElbB [Alphaproteobacteria bacterium 33-17]
MKKNVAVILSGCGYLDGSEIREAVLTLLSLDELDLTYTIFAPDKDQHHVVNHVTNLEENEERNIMIESARIARGEITPLAELNVNDFESLILPGGFGVAKNFSSIAFDGSNATITEDIDNIIQEFHRQDKKIGAICIVPALIALSFKGKKCLQVTLGDDNESNRNLIEGMDSKYIPTTPGTICIDETHKIASCAAYMRSPKLSIIHQEIKQVVEYLAKTL